MAEVAPYHSGSPYYSDIKLYHVCTECPIGPRIPQSLRVHGEVWAGYRLEDRMGTCGEVPHAFRVQGTWHQNPEAEMGVLKGKGGELTLPQTLNILQQALAQFTEIQIDQQRPINPSLKKEDSGIFCMEAISQLPNEIQGKGENIVTERTIWMIRGEVDGMIVKHFLNERVAYIGWWIGPIRPTDSKEIIRHRLYQRYPSEKDGAVPNIIGMLKRFSCEVQVGDHFVTYEPEPRLYHIGTVTSDARQHSPKWFGRDNVFGYLRDVIWPDKVSRDDLSREARNCLGSQLSHFRLSPTVSAEIRSRL